MEIKNIGGIMNTYKKVSLNGMKKDEAKIADKNIDKIEFNFARSIEAAKTDISLKLQEDLSSEKVENLAQSIKNGEYGVSTEDIVDSILMF